jgi:nitroreductase
MERKDINGHPFVRYHSASFTQNLEEASLHIVEELSKRRSLRDFSDRSVPQQVIKNLIQTAGTAPSGAHQQPWTFVAVQDKALKAKIREAAEQEEKLSYNQRMSEQWLQDLKPLGTDWQKPFLTTAPWLIVVFRHVWREGSNGEKIPNYYVQESVGLACGFLLAAIHRLGLVALTHTPSPMGFLTELLERPANEKPFLLIPVGYAAEEAWVPDLKRKPLDEIMVLK